MGEPLVNGGPKLEDTLILQVDHFEMHFIWLSRMSQWDWTQVSHNSGQTDLRRHLSIVFSSFSLPFLFHRIISQINYLPASPCLQLCFPGRTQGKIGLYPESIQISKKKIYKPTEWQETWQILHKKGNPNAQWTFEKMLSIINPLSI